MTEGIVEGDRVTVDLTSTGPALATIQVLEAIKRRGWELVDPKAQTLVEYTELRDAWAEVMAENGIRRIAFITRDDDVRQTSDT